MKLHVPKGPGEKRHNAGLAHGSCGGFCRDGQQLAWLTAKIEPLEGHIEVEFLAEVSVPRDHLARPTNIDTTVSIFEVLCLRSGSVLPYSEIYSLNLLLESQGEKKKTEDLAGYDERACLGGSAGGW